MDTIEGAVLDAIAEDMSVDRATLTAATHLEDDLGVDSIDAASIIVAIEERTGLTIPDDALDDVETVGAVVDLVKRLAAEGTR